MKIAIDLNDVIRDYTENFIRQYLTYYNHEYDTDELDVWTNDMESVLPFKSTTAYNHFVYEDYSYELFGKCDVCSKKLIVELKTWLNKLKDIDREDPIELMLVSTKEGGASLNYTYFFISKLGFDIREVFLPANSLDIWNKCDVLITANPLLLNAKSEGKISIKIEAPYNGNFKGDFCFKNLSEFITDINNTEKLLEKWDSQ